MEIRIGRSAHKCAACESAFVHEQDIWSLARIAEGELTREDYCGACWDTERARQAFSVWSVKYYDPKVAEQEPPEVFSPLRQVFYEAVEKEERPAQAKAFLAAQLLRRQKVFRQIKESQDEETGRLILYSDCIGNWLIVVHDPNFSYVEMENARLALLARLQELEQPEELVEEQSEEQAREGHEGRTVDSEGEPGREHDEEVSEDTIAQ